MKILLCGSQKDCRDVIDQSFQTVHTVAVACDYEEELLRYMTKDQFDFAVILFDGADGMEAVMTVKRQQPDLPVIWFSNDKGFAAQSYRLNTAYFHEKPITPQILDRAFNCCQLT